MTGEQLRKLRHELLDFVATVDVDLADVAYFETPTGACHFPISKPCSLIEITDAGRRGVIVLSDRSLGAWRRINGVKPRGRRKAAR